MLVGVALLTCLAISDDRKQPAYAASVKAAHRDAERIKVLAKANGIPVSGAATLLREDPYSQGPRIFARGCASCPPIRRP